MVHFLPLLASAPRYAANLSWALVSALAPFGAKCPDFVILGTQKGGTTSLHNYLCQHPQVATPWAKEIHYFDDNFSRGERWYSRQLIHPVMALDAIRANRICGDTTPYYLFHPRVAERLARHSPNARLIALLRDPVARAYSHYQHNVRRDRERLSFPEAIHREEKRIADAGLALETGALKFSAEHRHFSYLSRGLYADQLERFLRFFPRDQILILKSEDLFAHPQAIFDQATTFLRLAPISLKGTSVHNEGSYVRGRIPLEDQLKDYYKPHNERLYTLISRDMAW